jgi:flagellar P-ring protein precursor FlgI
MTFLIRFIVGVFALVTLPGGGYHNALHATVTQQSVLKPTATFGKNPTVRLKDICHFANVRENQLVGYGLVVGLNGTGDTVASAPFTKESLTSMLERLGVNIRDGAVPSGKNIAAVMVTASLPPFGRQGSKIDVTVSALGDAKDLRGGTLLVTPLLGADGEVYAVSQGSVAVSGYNIQGRAASQTKGVPTSGKITNGAIIEKEVGFTLTNIKALNLSLNNPDFTTARRISDAINFHFNGTLAKAVDSSTVVIELSPEKVNNLVGFITEIEQITVEPDLAARVVIDDQNGVIAITSNVKMHPIALTHGSFTVKIIETPKVYFPGPSQDSKDMNININAGNNTDSINPSDQVNALLAKHQEELKLLDNQQKQQITIFQKNNPDAESVFISQLAEIKKQHEEQKLILYNNQQKELNELTTTTREEASKAKVKTEKTSEVVSNTLINAREEKGKFTLIDSGANLEDFVNALNALGATPRDMTAILQNIKSAGALQAEITLT